MDLNINGATYNFEGGYDDPLNCIYTINFNIEGEIDM